MSGTTQNPGDSPPAHDDEPPSGTAIVRPQRHVRAVRERYLARFADPSDAAASRSARAWAWALGEDPVAPVTGRRVPVPPSRADIEAEIAAADQRRLRGDRENRADAAATVLRWLIGADDHLPVRGDNPGELVGGFADVVRPVPQIACVLAEAVQAQRAAAIVAHDVRASPQDRQAAQQRLGYFSGVAATLAWVLGDQEEAPVTCTSRRELTTRDLKTERLHAQDVTEQASRPWMAASLPPPSYGQGVRTAISWLLGDTTVVPTGPVAQQDLPGEVDDADPHGPL